MRDVVADGPAGSLAVTYAEDAALVVPPLLGSYRIAINGKTETRVAAAAAGEVDLRPRAASSTSAGTGLGERRAAVDVSGFVALALLALLAIEMALRLAALAITRPSRA